MDITTSNTTEQAIYMQTLCLSLLLYFNRCQIKLYLPLHGHTNLAFNFIVVKDLLLPRVSNWCQSYLWLLSKSSLPIFKGSELNHKLPYRGKFSRMVNLKFTIFAGLIFSDVRTHSHYVPYNQTYFTGLIFVVRQSAAKTAKIGPLENFSLYGIPHPPFSCAQCTFFRLYRL